MSSPLTGCGLVIRRGWVRSEVATRTHLDEYLHPVTLFGPTDYTIRVELEGVDPVVWRRLRISSDLSLPLFARVLEAAMGWQSYHLHQFVSGNLTFGDADDEMGYTIDETNVVIKQILPEIGHDVRFDYDFGDDWHHVVRVEAIIERGYGDPPSALVLDGARACPPEDVGGVEGYAHLVEVLRDPASEEYGEIRRWAGRSFKPEAFDLLKTQRAVAKLLPRPRQPKTPKRPDGPGSIVRFPVP